MIGLIDEVIKDIEKILKPILQKNQYDVVSLVPKVQKDHAQDAQVDVIDSSISEEKVSDKRMYDEKDKEEDEVVKESKVEDTQKPPIQPVGY